MKLKLLGAALLAAAVAAPAYADVFNGGSAVPGATAGDGELFLSVWNNMGTADEADDVSYTLDLGITLNSFASAANTPVAIAPQPDYLFAPDATLTTFLSGADLNNLTWNVVGFDSYSADRIATTNSGATGSNLNYSQLRTLTGVGQTYLAAVNGGMPGTAVSDNLSATFVKADAGFAGDQSFGTNIGGGLDFNNAGSIGSELGFWMISEAVASGSTTVKVTNLEFDGNWFLSDGISAFNGQTYAAGTLVYAAPVPEADTYALLLAGLGMVGFMARRRKVA